MISALYPLGLGVEKQLVADALEACAIDQLDVRSVQRAGTASLLCYELKRPVWFYWVAIIFFPLGTIIAVAAGNKRDVLLAQFNVREGTAGCTVEGSGPNLMLQYRILIRLTERLRERELLTDPDFRRIHGRLMAGDG